MGADLNTVLYKSVPRIRGDDPAWPAKSFALRIREFSLTKIAPSMVIMGSDIAAMFGESITMPEKASKSNPSTNPFD